MNHLGLNRMDPASNLALLFEKNKSVKAEP